MEFVHNYEIRGPSKIDSFTQEQNGVTPCLLTPGLVESGEKCDQVKQSCQTTWQAQGVQPQVVLDHKHLHCTTVSDKSHLPVDQIRRRRLGSAPAQRAATAAITTPMTA